MQREIETADDLRFCLKRDIEYHVARRTFLRAVALWLGLGSSLLSGGAVVGLAFALAGDDAWLAGVLTGVAAVAAAGCSAVASIADPAGQAAAHLSSADRYQDLLDRLEDGDGSNVQELARGRSRIERAEDTPFYAVGGMAHNRVVAELRWGEDQKRTVPRLARWLAHFRRHPELAE